ncbi:hypothetical protein [Plantactinospora sp. CA-290183]|uniref:hypothetical protein n=1 Tax=Plantactinospora sp. CA-290183 TaxID=3240006 RepID=UPI003D8BBA73
MIPSMTTDPLNEAARALVAAQKAVQKAKDDLAEGNAAVRDARPVLADQIVAAARGGMRQRDILERIENVYTRERVRQICRAAGVEPTE